MRYADDTTWLATSSEELQHHVNELQKISLLFGLEINSAKTCMIVIDPGDIGTHRVLIDGKEIERVNKFKYLGSLVTVDSNSTTYIKARLTIAKHATLQLTGIWKAKDVDGPKETTCTITDTKYRIMRVRKLGAEEVR